MQVLATAPGYTASVPPALCRCVPTELRFNEAQLELISTSTAPCCMCQRRQAVKLVTTMLFKCRIKPTRAHFITAVLCCGEGDDDDTIPCTRRFEELYAHAKTRYGGLERIVAANYDGQGQWSDCQSEVRRFLQANPLGVIACAAPDCGMRELFNGPKFSKCGRCRCVSYCSRECQTCHWRAEHRAHCKPLSAPATSPPPSNISRLAEAAAAAAAAAAPGNSCACLDEHERHMFMSLERGHCANLGCFRRIEGAVQLEMHFTNCTLEEQQPATSTPTGKRPQHACACTFCSDSCRRRALKHLGLIMTTDGCTDANKNPSSKPTV